jgi:hypothetical protein
LAQLCVVAKHAYANQRSAIRHRRLRAQASSRDYRNTGQSVRHVSGDQHQLQLVWLESNEYHERWLVGRKPLQEPRKVFADLSLGSQQRTQVNLHERRPGASLMQAD